MAQTLPVLDFNIVIKNEFWDESIETALFSTKDGVKAVITRIEPCSFDKILVMCGVFPSRNAAKSNWKKGLEVPPGYNDFTHLGKLQRRITVWNPVKGEE